MADYETDEEQIEALKKWWDENGTSLILTIVVSLLVVFGFKAWQSRVQEEGEAASGLYQDLVSTVVIAPNEALDDSAKKTGQYLAESLRRDHGGSVYARFAALVMAKQAVEEGDLERAEEELRWVIGENSSDSIGLIANLRLARVLVAGGNHDDALALVEGVDPGSHATSYGEVKGDILLQLGRQSDAREAYSAALAQMAEEGSRPLLQMKLDDLSVSPPTTEVTGLAPESGQADQDPNPQEN